MTPHRVAELAESLRTMASNPHTSRRYTARLNEAAEVLVALQKSVPKVNSDRIYHAVLRSPGTSEEIAAELGMPAQSVSAVLSKLYRMGLVARSERRIARDGPTSAYVYRRRA